MDRNRLTAYSLLEMLVVLTIVGMLLAVIPPLLPDVISGTRTKGAVRELGAALKYARSQAVSSQEEVALRLNVRERRYAVLGKEKQLSIAEEAQLILTTAISEQISEDEGMIRFFADGSSTGGGIRLKADRLEYLIEVNWLTGKVTITP